MGDYKSLATIGRLLRKSAVSIEESSIIFDDVLFLSIDKTERSEVLFEDGFKSWIFSSLRFTITNTLSPTFTSRLVSSK